MYEKILTYKQIQVVCIPRLRRHELLSRLSFRLYILYFYRIDRWRNGEMRHRVDVIENLSRIFDWKVLKCFGHVERRIGDSLT